MEEFKKDYEFGFTTKNKNTIELPKGHSEEVVREISKLKNEPKWMLELRLKAYRKFLELPMPNFGPDLSEIDFNDVIYYTKPVDQMAREWEDIPENIRTTFDKLGISKEEQKWLGGVATQFDSEMVYAQALSELRKQGVIFEGTDEALKNHPELFKKYFGKLVNYADNKFAALNTAFWSGGSFIYVPKGVDVDRPLQSYFRINTKGAGQFERSLIIVDEGAKMTYAEGCTAPTFSMDNLHAAVVEVFVEKDAHARYVTIQNWSNNVVNLVTKRALCEERAAMEWIDGNMGSKINMKYPATILKGDYSRNNTISIAVGMGKNVLQDAGAKAIHIGNNTSSTILSKSIAGYGGTVNYRGKVLIHPDAKNARSKVECDTMILDEFSKSDTMPDNIVSNRTSSIEHEAVVSKISEKEIYYLQTKGLTEDEAREMIVMGFVEPFAKEVPLEYASELNRLIKIEMEGNIG